MLLVILTALNMPVWLIMTNLNKADFQYSYVWSYYCFVRVNIRWRARIFFCLYLIYSCNNLLHEPHFCKNISVSYKKTILNIDWHDILPFIYINEFFHDKEISHKVHGTTRTENTRHI